LLSIGIGETLLGARNQKHYLQALSYFTYFSYSQLQLIIWIKTRLSKLNREKPRWQRKDINQAKKNRNEKKHNGSWSISRAQAAAA